MKAKESIKHINKEINFLNNQMEEICNKLSKLHEAEEKLLREIIYEEKILSKIEWVMKVANYTRSIVELLPDNNFRQQANDIANFLDPHSYHFGFDLKEAGCSFRFDDGSVKILFNEKANIKSFIENNCLKVKFKDIDKEIACFRHQANRLEKIKKLVV